MFVSNSLICTGVTHCAVCIADIQVSLSLLIRRANTMSPALKLIVQKFVPFPAVGQLPFISVQRNTSVCE